MPNTVTAVIVNSFKARGQTRCDACEVLTINGVRCHEHGCPDAWKDEIRNCKWCGQEFTPHARAQFVCDDDCAEAYYG